MNRRHFLGTAAGICAASVVGYEAQAETVPNFKPCLSRIERYHLYEAYDKEYPHILCPENITRMCVKIGRIARMSPDDVKSIPGIVRDAALYGDSFIESFVHYKKLATSRFYPLYPCLMFRLETTRSELLEFQHCKVPDYALVTQPISSDYDEERERYTPSEIVHIRPNRLPGSSYGRSIFEAGLTQQFYVDVAHGLQDYLTRHS